MSRKQGAEKARYWQRTIREAARSGVSIREFCRVRKLKVSQFYWWQRRSKETGQLRMGRSRVAIPLTGNTALRMRSYLIACTALDVDFTVRDARRSAASMTQRPSQFHIRRGQQRLPRAKGLPQNNVYHQECVDRPLRGRSE